MHWLQERIQQVFRDLDQYSNAQDRVEDTTDITGVWMTHRAARTSLLQGLSRIAQESVVRHGVIAAFVEHDGLIMEWAGAPENQDAIAAAARGVAQGARESAYGTPLGHIRQVVVIGSDYKLALILIGDITMGFYSKSDVVLASALSS